MQWRVWYVHFSRDSRITGVAQPARGGGAWLRNRWRWQGMLIHYRHVALSIPVFVPLSIRVRLIDSNGEGCVDAECFFVPRVEVSIILEYYSLHIHSFFHRSCVRMHNEPAACKIIIENAAPFIKIFKRKQIGSGSSVLDAIPWFLTRSWEFWILDVLI